jgi:hypothetical protein
VENSQSGNSHAFMPWGNRVFILKGLDRAGMGQHSLLANFKK